MNELEQQYDTAAVDPLFEVMEFDDERLCNEKWLEEYYEAYFALKDVKAAIVIADKWTFNLGDINENIKKGQAEEDFARLAHTDYLYMLQACKGEKVDGIYNKIANIFSLEELDYDGATMVIGIMNTKQITLEELRKLVNEKSEHYSSVHETLEEIFSSLN